MAAVASGSFVALSESREYRLQNELLATDVLAVCFMLDALWIGTVYIVPIILDMLPTISLILVADIRGS